jgi:hypothetical protein
MTLSRGSYDVSNYFYKDTALAISALPVTVACWVYPTTDLNTEGYCVSISDGTNNNCIALGLDEFSTDSTYGFVRGAGSTIQEPRSQSSVIQYNAWQHIALVVKNASYVTAYHNGTAGTAVTTTTGSLASCAYNYVGVRRLAAVAKPLAGYIAYIGVWTAELSGSEISQLAAGAYPSSIQSGSLVRYWDCQEGTNSSLIDSSSNLEHLAMMNNVPSQSTGPSMGGTAAYYDVLVNL